MKKEKVDVMTLEKGDYVFCKGECGVVTKIGRTCFHDHDYVKVTWLNSRGLTYTEKYFDHDEFRIDRIR